MRVLTFFVLKGNLRDCLGRIYLKEVIMNFIMIII